MTHGFSSTGSAQVASPGYAPPAVVVAQTWYDTVPVPVIGVHPTEIVPSPGVPETPVGDGVTAAALALAPVRAGAGVVGFVGAAAGVVAVARAGGAANPIIATA